MTRQRTSQDELSSSECESITAFPPARGGLGGWLKETLWQSSNIDGVLRKRSRSFESKMPCHDPATVDQLQRELALARQEIKLLRGQAAQQKLDAQPAVFKDPTSSNVWTMKISLSSSDESSQDDDVDRSVKTSCTDLLEEEICRFSYATIGDTPSEIWHTIPFENHLGGERSQDYDASNLPVEITAIYEGEGNEEGSTIEERLQNAEFRARAFRHKLEEAEDLVESLFRDMERAKQTVLNLASTNSSFDAQINEIKMDVEDNMLRRDSFAKACVYISPLFIYLGSVEIFLCAVIMVWIIVEIDSIVDIDVDEEGQDD